MKGLLIALLSLPVYSNTFQLEDTGARFYLKIEKDKLFYRSETISQEIELSDCSFPYANSLNSNLLASLPNSIFEHGLKFRVDGELYRVGTDLSKKILMMDARIISFITSVGEACQ